MHTACGIILKREDFRERDERVTLYTKESGKITVAAKGVKRIEAKLRGCLDVFNFVDITFVEGAYFSILTAVEVRERFGGLATDASCYRAAFSVAKTVSDVFEENQRDGAFFEVLCATLEKLNEYAGDGKASLYCWLLAKKFQLALLECQGHAPDFAGAGMSKEALRLLGMLKGEAHSSVHLPRGDFARIEEAFCKTFAYTFNCKVPSWTP